MSEAPSLERPDDTWEGFTNWRGPRGTAIDSWTTEVRGIRDAIQEREEQRRSKDRNYRSPASVLWRLDCLGDLLVVLEGQPRL